MKDAVIDELAGTWEVMAENELNAMRRQTLRECADTLRMLVQALGDKPPRPACPHAAPFKFCPHCVVDPCPIGMPQPKAAREHIASKDCWCLPEVDYIDPLTGSAVLIHKYPQ